MAASSHLPERSSATRPALIEAPWAELIPDDQWAVFQAGAEAARASGVEFLLGGAMALAAYTDHWRNTKDIDFFVHPNDAPRLVEAVRSAGFEDYYAQQAYDRSWIFRATRDGVILDIIWALPNHRVNVDQSWFNEGRQLQLRREVFRVIPLEEIICIKLYVMQRERCDWVDVLNVLACAVDEVNWERLLVRMGKDLPLLHGVLAIFNWMCPERAKHIPSELRERFALPEIETSDSAAMEQRRVRLFDSRPWFAAHQPLDRPLDR